MEYTRCRIQYVGKSEPPFSQRLNNHRHNACHPKEDFIQACKHYTEKGCDFNRDAKFTIIEQIHDKNKTNNEKGEILLRRENFWITALKTLKPKGFNQELNNI